MFAILEAPAIAPDIRIECLRGSEALCRPYTFDMQLTVTGGEIDLAEAVGSAATLRLARDGDEPQRFHGVLASVRLLVQTRSWALYEATLVPRVWHLGLTSRSRVFTKQTVPEIIEAVLKANDLTSSDYELRLTADYQAEELVCQYRESDLDFLHRWMEHEGLYYHFEQTDEGAKMVIVDAASAHDKLAEKIVRYHPLMGHDTSAGECFDSFTVRHDTTVKAVRLADYDYARPALDLSASRDVSPNGHGQLSLHGARFFDPGQAERYAKLRAEELVARQILHHASGTALHVAAGYLVELSDHPSDKLNARYLATEVTHFVNQLPQERDNAMQAYLKPEYEDVYRVQATLIDAAVQYRPPLRTPRPRVWGFENGIVDGETDSPYAQIDDQGRYLVKFMFDESDLEKGKASTYVRMMQPHGGATEGFHFPLRKGTEVVFSFLGGDPDRPVIAGVVPNAAHPSPVVADNHSQNWIQTGGGSHIKIEDLEAKKFFDLFTPPKNTFIHLGEPHEDHGGYLHFNTGGNQVINIGGNRDITVGAAKTMEISTTFHTETGGTITVEGGDAYHVEISNNITFENGGEYHVESGANQTFETAGSFHVEASGSITFENAGEYHVESGGVQTFETPASFHVESGADATFEAAGSIHAEAGASVTAEAGTSIDLTAPNIAINGAGSVTINTPSWSVNGPSWKTKYAARGTAGGFAANMTGVSIAFTGLSITGVGIKLGNLGANLNNFGATKESAGAKAENEGAKAGSGGILSELRGIITLA